jgi:hypothetical protein
MWSYIQIHIYKKRETTHMVCLREIQNVRERMLECEKYWNIPSV